ncbi:hypothetical protein [Mesorhizobium sp.]|uniref:hypothetical protein n=1 Tax=Mesorhizobium sp. TaxID=1871066 RepID=UPI000FEA0F3A|nr:hypothetical protein [Mesorhizobium sp.]RWM29418.1 MAG: hypothetical protein EOR74_06995 [Mesorhizobium sp.]
MPFAASVNPPTFEQDFDFVTEIDLSGVCPGFVPSLSGFPLARIFSDTNASSRFFLTGIGLLAAEGLYGT